MNLNMSLLNINALVDMLNEHSLQIDDQPLSITAIALLMARTHERTAKRANDYLFMHIDTYEKLIKLPDIELLFDPMTLKAGVERGEMGSLLGMDVRVNPNVPADVLIVANIRFEGLCIDAVCTSMKVTYE